MSGRKVFHTAEEALEYMFSKEIESDIIVLPPDVDELTDEECFDEKNEITIVKWKDNKCVTTATNFDYIEPVTQVSRHQTGLKEKSQILQPSTIAQYNKNMGGVDQHDWLLEKHTIQIRGKKWYWSIFTRGIDMAVVNTYILFNLTNCEKKSIKDIRRYIAVEYLKRGTNSQKSIGRPLMMSSRPKVIDSVRLDRKDHVIGQRQNQRRCPISKM